MNKNWIIVVGLAAAIYFYWHKNSQTQNVEVPQKAVTQLSAHENARPKVTTATSGNSAKIDIAQSAPRRVQEIPKNQKNQRKDALPFSIDEGLAIVQGDLVVGVPVDENPNEHGLVLIPKVDLWPTNIIPYYIQPNVKDPERIFQALEMFHGTAVQFVLYTDQEDVLVFEDSVGICKSYVGRIGGKQPIWVPTGCEASEVAHEIMHALGFVHEQNRSDRDQFIRVMNENIKEEYKDNFELLPPDMMKLSGLDQFDFESIMIYPTSMFAKGSQPTMMTKLPNQEIRPSFGLSEKDKARLNRAFNK